MFSPRQLPDSMVEHGELATSRGTFVPVGLGFEDKAVRLRFMRQLFSVLLVQLLIDVAVCATSIFLSSKQVDLLTSSYPLRSALVTLLVCFYVLGWQPALARTFPVNYIAFGAFTMAQAVMVCAVCVAPAPWPSRSIMTLSLSIASVITLVLCVACTQTAVRYTTNLAVHLALGTALLCAVPLAFLSPPLLSREDLLYGDSAAAIVGVYFAMSVQLLVHRGGRVGPGESVLGALYVVMFGVAAFFVMEGMPWTFEGDVGEHGWEALADAEEGLGGAEEVGVVSGKEGLGSAK